MILRYFLLSVKIVYFQQELFNFIQDRTLYQDRIHNQSILLYTEMEPTLMRTDLSRTFSGMDAGHRGQLTLVAASYSFHIALSYEQLF